MANSIEENEILQRNNITQIIQIQLTRLQVYTYSRKKCKPHKCNLCTYSSKFKSNLNTHMRLHTGEKPFSCALCTYKSSQLAGLNVHILTHTGEKPWNCAFCKKSFRRSSGKNCHEKICKVNPKQSDPSWVEMQRVAKCQLCPYSTDQKCKLKRHLMTHSGEKPFPCNICHEMFSRRDHLQNHIFRHTREKPSSCPFCRKGFVNFKDQKRHEKICKVNPKQGDAKWVEEQKKFKCHLCNYRTIAKSGLRVHLRVHTGETPFKCPLCIYKCRRNSNLHSHLRRVHMKAKGYKFSKCEVQKS